MSRTRRASAARLVVGTVLSLVVVAGCAGPSSGGHGPSSGPTGAGVVWRSGTTTDSVLDSYRVTPWNTDDATDPRAVTSPDLPGRAAVEYTVPGGGTRSELEPSYRSFRPGDDYWFGFAVYLPKDFPVNTSDWQVIAQWKNSGDGSPPLSIQVRGGRFVLDGGEGIGKHWSRDVGPARAGTRTDLVLRVHFSDDPSEGSVDVIQDGREVVSGYRPRGGTLYPGEASYLKTGLYRSSDIGDDGSVYFDDVVIATSREAASSLASSS
ncbi:polysaccharide lyase [Actinomycetospora chiangmaiensis]|uniref:polysaccharide lyase n=1 Tax=Actinomycetospora chiangmaiensis TaxID=402650 RepID=UPI000382B726|nr:polysaccharide lyase [Actinomycetospora chiangmaiensis]